ncbi:MAG: hypothetical protein KDA44_18555 [Planctomycetales bacterium]|nr:hypothetical protein [Planctomycetales bacterium]
MTALAIIAIVVLRLAAGWHFWCEGTKKLAYDSDGHLYVAFSAEGFFKQAVGPFAGFFHSKLPDFHQWQTLLAKPQEQTEQSAAEIAQWAAGYDAAQVRAAREKKTAEAEIPELAPYHAWATQVIDDLQAVQEKLAKSSAMTDEARAAAAAQFEFRKRQLAEYLATEATAIAEWQHELWRLKHWEESPEAGDLPFTEERIAEKKAETTAAGRAWVDQVAGIERGFYDDLHALAVDADGKSDAKLAAAVAKATADKRAEELAFMNLAVTCLIITVGFCLLVGLFTRLAALGGMAFLLSVVATQPPWVAGAAPVYYQVVECAALFVLFATAAGRYGGLDFFLHALWRKLRGAPSKA